MNQPAWSWSTYEKSTMCWRQLWYVKHAPNGVKVKDDYSGAAAEEGTRVHEMFEMRVKCMRPIPRDYLKSSSAELYDKHEKFFKAIDKIRQQKKGKILPECDLTFRQDWSETHWKDYNNAWLRAGVDLLIMSDTHAIVWDYKNGSSRWVEDMQLKLYALAIFKKWPKIQSVKAGFYWVQTGGRDMITVDRSEMKAIEQFFHDDFLDERDEYLAEYEGRPWPATAKQDWVCKNCPAKDKCEDKI